MGKSGSKSMCGTANILSEDLNSLAKDTTFTVNQLKRWQAEFMDDCPDGRMTKSIFKDKFGDIFNPNPSSSSDLNMAQLADFVFERFDSNGDGWISFPEFIRAISSPTRGSLDDKLEWAFAIYDVDRDGFITREEMVSIVSAIYRKRGFNSDDGHIARRRVDEIFLRMDQNDDGKLSKWEFMEGFKNDPIILKALLYHEAERKRSWPETAGQDPAAGTSSPGGSDEGQGQLLRNLPTPTTPGSRSPSIAS